MGRENLEALKRVLGPTALGAGRFHKRSILYKRRQSLAEPQPIDESVESQGLVCGRLPDGRYHTNVKWQHRMHSVAGFAWGYYGWESLELALNTLAELLPGSEVRLLDDSLVSRRAWDLHFEFCQRFLVFMPTEGRVVPLADIQTWITRQLTKEGMDSQ